jgi:hypothetical protein
MRQYHRDWYGANRERVLEKGRDWSRENRNRIMWRSAKGRAKKLGLPFSISPEDIIIPEICPVLGIPLVIASDSGNDNSPSLDRIIPELGYVPGNVAVISRRANRIKNDANLNELKKVVAWLESKQ